MKAVVTEARDESILTITIDNPPVNASSQAVREGLLRVLRSARDDADVRAVILCGSGRTFMAGADIGEFALASLPAPDPNEIFEAIETLGRPVIAALQGTVLGGGLELAMAAHYRVCLSTAVLGLPEVKLGLLPGAGGTQRLPRLVGVRPALDMMVGGAPISAAKAFESGLVDAVVDDRLYETAMALARRLIEERMPTLPVASRRRVDVAELGPTFFAAYRQGLPSARRGGRAALEIVRCVQASVELPIREALMVERASFEDLRASAESVALRHVFFSEREATRIPGVPRDAARMPVRKIAVVGAGTMGGGIAMAFSNAGFPVTLVEASPDALDHRLGVIRMYHEAAVSKGRCTAAEAERRIRSIRGSLDLEDVSDADLVIEAVFEDLDLKRQICRRLGEVCRTTAIVASNTSTLDVDVLAQAYGRPSQFVGMHFFSPAHVMRLLEVVRGASTSSEVLATVMALAKAIGKAAVVSGVCYGFIGNRMLECYLRETEFLLMEGATPAQIDGAVEGFGMAMGPCRMIDMAGVDVAARVVLERQKAGGLPDDPSYRAVVRRLHDLGRMGQKAAIGYYRYDGRSAVSDPAVDDICRQLAREHGIDRRTGISDMEIVERCLFPLINEGARILEEGIAYRAGDIDVVWTQGYGFPAYKGGPMHLLGAIGARALDARLRAFAVSRGDPHGYWTVCSRLSTLAGPPNAIKERLQ